MKTEDRKIYEPESIQETPLPEAVIWEEIVDKPTTLAELSPTDAAALSSVETSVGDIETTIASLGDLAYEDIITALQLADGAVTNVKIAVDAIQGAVIAAGAITSTKIADGSIETPKIATGAVTAGTIAAGAITASKIGAGEVTASKISSINLSVIQAVVGSLSAITANIGSITAGSISGVTITGGTIQTSTSGKRVVIDDANDRVSFLFDSTIYGYIEAFGGGSSLGVRVISYDSQLILDDGLAYAALVVNGLGMTIDSGSHANFDRFIRLAQLSSGTASGLTPVNGSMYYRTDDNVIRAYVNGSWRTVTTS